jgi:hypothetical protein
MRQELAARGEHSRKRVLELGEAWPVVATTDTRTPPSRSSSAA